MNNLKPAWIEVTTNNGDKFILDPVIESGRVQIAKESGLTVKPLYYAPRAWMNLTETEINELTRKWAGELIFEVTQKLKEKNYGQT
jgi:hypothetical protein